MEILKTVYLFLTIAFSKNFKLTVICIVKVQKVLTIHMTNRIMPTVHQVRYYEVIAIRFIF
jgi:hypothetical protein